MASKGCGRFPIKLHEKLKRATTLRIPLKPLLAIPRVVTRFSFQFIFKQIIYFVKFVLILQMAI